MLYTKKGDDGKTTTFGCDLPAPRPGIFYVYAILCGDNSIYIGQTNDLSKRLDEHVSGSGAEHTSKFGAEKIIHYEEFLSREDAVKREHDLKTGFGRKWLKREWLAGRTRQAGQRFSKSSAISEALGTLDETNSYLGIIKSKVESLKSKEEIEKVQQNLFIIQAQVAGATKNISEESIKEIESRIDEIEKVIPAVKSFIISGTSEISAMFDFGRTLARRAERRVVEVYEENLVSISKETLSYLNRLSSLLFALARYENFKNGLDENKPRYS